MRHHIIKNGIQNLTLVAEYEKMSKTNYRIVDVSPPLQRYTALRGDFSKITGGFHNERNICSNYYRCCGAALY